MNFAGLEYLQIMLAPLAPILFLIGAIVAVWLILRPLRMWYWKVDKQERELENVNRQLTEIKTAITDNKDNRAAEAETVQIRETQSAETLSTDTVSQEVPRAEVQSAEEPAEPQTRRKRGIRNYDTDKNGRKYTQEEIEAQIRD